MGVATSVVWRVVVVGVVTVVRMVPSWVALVWVVMVLLFRSWCMWWVSVLMTVAVRRV